MRIYIILCMLLVTFAHYAPCQDFAFLLQKADSCLEASNYALGATYFDQAAPFADSQDAVKRTRFFYNAACAHSVIGHPQVALSYLTKFFEARKVARRQGVSDGHFFSDVDLDPIRNEPEYAKIIRRYFPIETVNFQERSEIGYQELIDYVKSLGPDQLNRDPIVRVRNKKIYWRKVQEKYVYNDDLLEIPEIINGSIAFQNCEFFLNLRWQVQQTPIVYEEFRLNKCIFHGDVFIADMGNYYTWIEDCLFEKDFYFDNIFKFPDAKQNRNRLIIASNKFNYAHIMARAEQELFLFELRNNISLDSSDIITYSNSLRHFIALDNDFSRNIYEMNVVDTHNITFRRNSVQTMIFDYSSISKKFTLSDCNMSLILFRDFQFTEGNLSTIDWASLSGKRLGVFKTRGSRSSGGGKVLNSRRLDFGFVSSQEKNNLKTAADFRDLMSLYSMWLNHFKLNNDIESYNAAFMESKDIQNSRLKILYQDNPSFETYFRWRLSQLLKFYVRYGTDPARAIVISLYIIMAFAILFFFFPSDWDTTSKKKLFENYRAFIEKNDKGYVKPFYVLIVGLVVSLINAITLSINAFVTLGFGNIPTHGVARYFCVLEGFFGWFLLSIFSVALINQFI